MNVSWSFTEPSFRENSPRGPGKGARRPGTPTGTLRPSLATRHCTRLTCAPLPARLTNSQCEKTPGPREARHASWAARRGLTGASRGPAASDSRLRARGSSHRAHTARFQKPHPRPTHLNHVPRSRPIFEPRACAAWNTRIARNSVDTGRAAERCEEIARVNDERPVNACYQLHNNNT